MKWKVKLKHFFGTSHTIPVQISQGANITFAENALKAHSDGLHKTH